MTGAPRQVDGGGEPAGVHIVEGDIVADCHPRHCRDNLRLVLFVEAGDHADRVERAIAEVAQRRVVLSPFLHEIGLPSGHGAQALEELTRGKLLPAAMPV